MHIGNYNNVIDALVSKSDFLSDFPDIIALARTGMEMTMKRHIVHDKKDLYDDNQNFKAGKYTSIVFNCQFKDTISGDGLYTSQILEPEEHLITCRENFASLQIGNIPQCSGVGVIAIAEQVREVFDDIVEKKGQDLAISDFRSDLIETQLGGLALVNFIQKPMDARVSEVAPVVLHRKVVNNILDTVLQPGDSVLAVGGDGGSASKRKRGYSIDCLYFSEKKARQAALDRKKYGTLGQDFFLPSLKDFSWETAHVKYKVVMFNYIGNTNIAQFLADQFRESTILVFGVVADPLMAHDSDIRDFGADEVAFDEYWKDYKVSINVNYKVLAVSDTRVAIYVDHGKFIDARWQPSEDYVSVNRQSMVQMMNIPCTFQGVEHGAVKFLNNRCRYIQTLNYSISCQTIEEYYRQKRIFRIHQKKMYDLNGYLVHPWIDLPNCQALVIFDEKENAYKFLDINIKGEYWYRRYVMSLSVDLCTGSGMRISPHRRFDDGPNEWEEHMRQLALSQDAYDMGMFDFKLDDQGVIDVERPIVKLPTLAIRGLYYNNMTHKWYYDEEVLSHYFPVDRVIAEDDGQDMEVVYGDYVMSFDMSFEEWTSIPISPTMAVRKVINGTRGTGKNYVRLYNYQRIKYPMGEYCAGWRGHKFKSKLENDCMELEVLLDCHVEEYPKEETGGLSLVNLDVFNDFR